MSTWADMLHSEILDDEDNPWYLAEDRFAGDNQLRLKFVNRNLNYYYLPNMVSVAPYKQQQFNPNLVVTLKFCNAAKSIFNTKGPFGRMIVHRLPAGKLLLIENTDIEYYQYVITSLFVINSSDQFDIHNYTSVIPSTKGSFFQFQPFSDRLKITNNSNGDMYFLTFDNWFPEGIKTAAQGMDPMEWLAKNPERRSQALTPKFSKMLYISKH